MGVTAEEYLGQWDADRRFNLPETTAGTVRLDVAAHDCTDHWYLTVADQHVQVSRSADDADLVIRADRQVFDQMVSGELHPGAALLRHELTVQGDMRLLMVLRRIFAGPSGARHPRELGRAAVASRASGGRADADDPRRGVADASASGRGTADAREGRP
ncbi:SCP2 sterol-binding domain-containing protein [Micromonospora sp. WMMD1120]|uniref:SCP2 sterol-binding domain-containing protein n=1 Tax=Micromonospora sp. WMMD1120 TaxID=3016106 RepID=UPI0024162987|nr:SCP2 sterol-binding domain-containing protein [Micromonospora sp. WMMD1120]MDG4808960.1 SCP2 sterol-binding domain-containing protein [Micromonospora sp. WMMD1120]